MKRLFKGIYTVLLSLSLVACGGKEEDTNKIIVSATATPHAEILEEAEELLKEKGYELEIVVLSDYYIFNVGLDEKEVDANYFQHIPFFEDEVKANGYDIVNAGGIHLEPFAFYSKSITSIDQLKEGDTIIISNSISDHGRILTILANAGVITLKEGVSAIDAVEADIVDNPKNLKFEEVKPELLASMYENNEGALVAINGNYALQAGLNALTDALLVEEADENNPYVNIVACRSEDKDSDKIKALVEVLKSEEIKTFIETKYKGSVIVAK